jgi:hypothetical protein
LYSIKWKRLRRQAFPSSSSCMHKYHLLSLLATVTQFLNPAPLSCCFLQLQEVAANLASFGCYFKLVTLSTFRSLPTLRSSSSMLPPTTSYTSRSFPTTTYTSRSFHTTTTTALTFFRTLATMGYDWTRHVGQDCRHELFGGRIG